MDVREWCARLRAGLQAGIPEPQPSLHQESNEVRTLLSAAKQHSLHSIRQCMVAVGLSIAEVGQAYQICFHHALHCRKGVVGVMVLHRLLFLRRDGSLKAPSHASLRLWLRRMKLHQPQLALPIFLKGAMPNIDYEKVLLLVTSSRRSWDTVPVPNG